MSASVSEWFVRIPVLLFAVTVHEYAHGRVALGLGDPTAKQAGRLTLNPLPHIDPFGAICLFLFNFGWARPVPVNPVYFRNIRRDTVMMALAGPAANFSVALGAGMLLRHALMPWQVYQLALAYLLLMNIGLGVFNLLPIPPLDGSHVIENVLSPGAARSYREFGRYGPILLLGIVMLDNFAHTGILSRVLLGPIRYLAFIFSGIHF